MISLHEKLKAFYMRFRIGRRLVRNQVALKSFLKNELLREPKELDVSSYKKSDCLVILGSGDSINQLSEEDWKSLSNYDSVGFNNWVLHPFVPTYYFFEPSGSQEKYRSQNKSYIHNIVTRAEDYKNTPLILSYQAKRYYDIDTLSIAGYLPRLYFQCPVNLPGDSVDELRSAIAVASEMGCFHHFEQCVYRRGTLARIFHFAIAAGYKKIILYGVDLNNSPYFFEHDSFKVAAGTRRPDLSVYKKPGDIHMTVNPEIHPITMFDVINELNVQVMIPNGIQLFNGSRSSALYSRLPFWDLSTTYQSMTDGDETGIRNND